MTYKNQKPQFQGVGQTVLKAPTKEFLAAVNLFNEVYGFKL